MFQARIDFIGFGAELVRHRDQGLNDALILEARGYPQATRGLPTQVCGTRHIDKSPTDSGLTPDFPSGSRPDWKKRAA
jgi:hypothetical protein